MKGQLEFIELIIMVIGIILFIILSYSIYTDKVLEVSYVISESHQSKIVRNVCENLPNLELPLTNRTLGQVFGDAIISDSYKKGYGDGTFLLDIEYILNQSMNEYLGNNSWQVIFPDGKIFGHEPTGDFETCIIFQPTPKPGSFKTILIKYW